TAKRAGGVINNRESHSTSSMKSSVRLDLEWWLILTLSIARTGRRNRKHSPERAALKTAAYPPRHKPAGFDFGPGRNVRHVAVDRELQGIHTDKLFVTEFLRHFIIPQFVQGTTS